MNQWQRNVAFGVLLAGILSGPSALRADGPYSGPYPQRWAFPLGGWTREIPAPPYFAIYPPAYFHKPRVAAAPFEQPRPDEPHAPGVWVVNPFASPPAESPLLEPLPPPAKALAPAASPAAAPTSASPKAAPAAKAGSVPAPPAS